MQSIERRILLVGLPFRRLFDLEDFCEEAFEHPWEVIFTDFAKLIHRSDWLPRAVIGVVVFCGRLGCSQGCPSKQNFKNLALKIDNQ